MKKLLLLSTILFPACATMGGGKGSVAPFPGPDAVQKRRNEISDAAKSAMDCMKVKPGEQPGKGGIFAVDADANGKLTITPIKWEGSDAVKQCIVAASGKTTISPLPGPSVGTLWEFVAPGEKPEPQAPPSDLAVKMQPYAETLQNAVIECGRANLGVDFGATIDVAYYLYNNGQAYAPTVIASDAKDGLFESCVQDVIMKTKFPTLDVTKPFGTTSHFKIGQYGATQHRKD